MGFNLFAFMISVPFHPLYIMCVRVHFPTCVTENPENWMKNFLPGTHGRWLVSRASRKFLHSELNMENVKIIYIKFVETTGTKVHERGEARFQCFT